MTLERLTAVDDYGVIVNPMIAAGQAHGAIAQGAGQALLEHAVYDPESGQPVSGSFMDYAMPRAGDLPSFDAVIRGHALHHQPGRGERLRRGRGGRAVPGHRQRHRRRGRR